MYTDRSTVSSTNALSSAAMATSTASTSCWPSTNEGAAGAEEAEVEAGAANAGSASVEG